MFKIFSNGHGGKHRNDSAALSWRLAIKQAAEVLRANNPGMDERFVQEHAELEVAHAFHLANAATRQREYSAMGFEA